RLAYGLERSGDAGVASAEAGAGLEMGSRETPLRGGVRRVDRQCRRRRVVEDEHDLGEQAMAGAEIDDASAAEEAAGAPRHFPGFVQLLAGEAARAADGAGDAIEERSPPKTSEIVRREARLRRAGERHAPRATGAASPCGP